MFFKLLNSKQFSYSENLSLMLTSLEDWIMIDVTGKDAEQYLQNQVTGDIFQIEKYQHIIVAHCNANGRIWSNLLLFRRNEGFSFIERRSVKDIQLAEMKKYAIFSKVMFHHDESIILLGISGFQARSELKNLFKELPNENKPLIHSNNKTSILWFQYPVERFLLISDKKIIYNVIKMLCKKAYIGNSQQWLLLHIKAGIPIIDLPNSGKFIPQAINLHIIGDLNFKKGCYLGQEMIARAQFRGVNKRSLHCLSGIVSPVPQAGEDIKLKINNSWRRIGTVLAAAYFENDVILVQAVMNNNSINPNNVFCIQSNSLNNLKLNHYLT